MHNFIPRGPASFPERFRLENFLFSDKRMIKRVQCVCHLKPDEIEGCPKGIDQLYDKYAINLSRIFRLSLMKQTMSFVLET